MLTQTYHSQPRHTLLTAEESMRHESPIEMRITYHNRTAHDITVCHRSGFRFVLHPIAGYRESEFVIRVQYSIQASAKSYMAEILNRVRHFSEELKVIQRAFITSYEVRAYGGVDFIVEYPITIDRLKDYGGTIYFKDVDIVVSLMNPDDCPPHPHSEEGLMLGIHEVSDLETNMSVFEFQLQIVDNKNVCGPRFLNIHNKIYRVQPCQDHQRRSGVYSRRSKEATKDGLGGYQTVTEYFSFEDGDSEFGLYRTYEDAMILGNLEDRRKEVLAKMEHDNALMKRELEQLKQKYQLEQIERENEKEELNALRSKEEHQRTVEKEKTKDYYESRSYQRKDTSEEIKFIPTLLVGIGAVLLSLKAIFF